MSFCDKTHCIVTHNSYLLILLLSITQNIFGIRCDKKPSKIHYFWECVIHRQKENHFIIQYFYGGNNILFVRSLLGSVW